MKSILLGQKACMWVSGGSERQLQQLPKHGFSMLFQIQFQELGERLPPLGPTPPTNLFSRSLQESQSEPSAIFLGASRRLVLRASGLVDSKLGQERLLDKKGQFGTHWQTERN